MPAVAARRKMYGVFHVIRKHSRNPELSSPPSTIFQAKQIFVLFLNQRSADETNTEASCQLRG